MTPQEAISKLRELGIRFHREANVVRDDRGRCPVVALAESLPEVPGTYDNCQWAEAADAAGIPYREALDLVTVSDSEIFGLLDSHENREKIASIFPVTPETLAKLRDLYRELMSLCEGK